MSHFSHYGILLFYVVYVWGVTSERVTSRLPKATSTSTTTTSNRPATPYNYLANQWITKTTKGPNYPHPVTPSYSYFMNRWITTTRTTESPTIPYLKTWGIDRLSVSPPKIISQTDFSSNSKPSASSSLKFSTTTAEKVLPSDATLLHQILIQETSLRVELQKTVWDLMKEFEQIKKNRKEENAKQDIVNQQLINNITLLRSENKKLKDELSILHQQAENRSSNIGLHTNNDFTNVSKELQSFKREFRYFSLAFLDIQQDMDSINTEHENITTAMKDIRDVKDILVRIQHKQFEFLTDLENLRANQTDMLVRVAFTATFSRSQPFRTDATLLFSNILTNIGNGYNSGTGIFTAPIGGVYVFVCKLTDRRDSDVFSIYFVKNGAIQGTNVGTEGPTSSFRSSSSSIVLELNPGDRVWMKVVGVSYSFHGQVINGEHMLTGFLL